MTKLKQFMLLFDKTEPERRKIVECKAANGFKFFFDFFKQTLVKHCSSNAYKSDIAFKILTFLLSRMTLTEFFTRFCIVELQSFFGGSRPPSPTMKNFLPTPLVVSDVSK